MIDVFAAYWPVIIAAVLIGLIVGYLLFRPRQRVRLTDSAPIRPHMTRAKGETVFGHEAEVTTKHVLGTQSQLGDSAGAGHGDDLEQLKGVGPKFAAILHAQGVSRFDQIARLNAVEVERLDAALGPFRGRLIRDRVLEQAEYLARGDVDGFEQRFGKL